MKNLYLVDSLGFLDDSFFDYTKKRKATGAPLFLGKPTRSRGIFSVSNLNVVSLGCLYHSCYFLFMLSGACDPW